MSIYRKYVNFTDKNSINFRLRLARLKLFGDLIQDLPKPIRILDVGGSEFYWEHLFFSQPENKRESYEITITNIEEDQLKISNQRQGYYRYRVADARAMPQFSVGSFDIVHSNSVIEHVGEIADQAKMASEVIRIGKHHFVQTPNYWFPIEPHFRTLGWQWLPRALRIELVQSRSFGSFPVACTRTEAENIVNSARLRTYREFCQLFPASKIVREKFMGVTKSFIAMA